MNVERASEIITWYANEGKNSLDLIGLMQTRAELAAISFFMAQHTGEAYHHYLAADHARKIAERGATEEKTNAGLAFNKAHLAAQLQTQDKRQAEKDAEAVHYACKLELNAVKSILDSMQQQIAYLKDERRAETYRENTKPTEQ